MVISCATPCIIQGLSDPDTATAMAITFNNKLASTIVNNTERFGGFAALPMHNATEAALEFKRALKELGFFGFFFSVFLRGNLKESTFFFLSGALLNDSDYQQ